ncbi:hypothetical protein [Haloarcula sp. CGMCC 1.6347]|uniref:hypothetical protein n=1 Tax=Haloarcula sp. CGMCC 1.6347 TaxID=3111455 RepID=UPI00300EEA40
MTNSGSQSSDDWEDVIRSSDDPDEDDFSGQRNLSHGHGLGFISPKDSEHLRESLTDLSPSEKKDIFEVQLESSRLYKKRRQEAKYKLSRLLIFSAFVSGVAFLSTDLYSVPNLTAEFAHIGVGLLFLTLALGSAIGLARWLIYDILRAIDGY